MRHKVAGRKLGRTSAHRMAMLRNMVTSLFVHERIRTTDPKAKEVRRLADKIVSLGKRGDLSAQRRVAAMVRGKAVTRKLFTDLADRFRDVPGGYTRVIKLGPRRGDGALMSMVELVGPPEGKRGRQKKGTKRATTRGKTASSRRSSKTEESGRAGKAEETKT
jgi:large subunit ribosomal protein L17